MDLWRLQVIFLEFGPFNARKDNDCFRVGPRLMAVAVQFTVNLVDLKLLFVV